MISISFLVTVATLALVYVMAAQLLNLEAGWGGMWDLGIAGLIGVGAYAYALFTGSEDGLVRGLGMPVGLGMLAAGAVTGVVALALGWPALRLRGEYFLITTFAFAEILRQLIVINRDITGGTFGFTGIPRPFEMQFTFQAYPYVLLGQIALMTVAVWFICARIAGSNFGATLRAARDNEPLARAMGKSIRTVRLSTYATVGVLCGLFVAPAYAWFLGALVPSIFGSHLTFTIWAGLVIGGLGSRMGPVIGALLLTGVSELVRLIEVAPEHAEWIAAIHPLLVGILLIAVLRWRPDGVVSERGTFAGIRRRRSRGRRSNAVSRSVSKPTGSLEGHRA